MHLTVQPVILSTVFETLTLEHFFTSYIDAGYTPKRTKKIG